MNKPQNILMVDDSGDNLLLMRAAFEIAKCPYPLQEVHNGEEAIAYLQGAGAYGDRNKSPLPTVMLLDLNMPKKNGFEVLAWVRAQPGLKRLAVIILSASMRVEDVAHAYDLGATAFLVKPLSLEELVAMLRCLGDWIKINQFPPLAKATPATGGPALDLSSLWLPVTGHAPLPMATVEGAGHIVRYVNPAFCRLMDKPTEQLVGKSFGEMLPEPAKCVTLLDRVFRTGTPGSDGEQQHFKPHPVFWFYTMWPVMAEERPVGVMIQVTEIKQLHEKTLALNEALLLGSVRQHERIEAADNLNLQLVAEITERKKAEHKLVAAKDEINHHVQHLEATVRERTDALRETIRELEGFSYSVSHDMRAPLRAMQSYGQYLVDEYGGKLDEKGVNYLQQIMRSALRLDRLIQDVLSYTRILHSPLPMETVDLDRLVRDIIETYPNGQPIKPQISIQGTLPKVMGNEALLTQCVSNLLDNGAKFVSPGTTPRLEISAEARAESLVRVWFKDNGIGIAPENHERIFGLLERIHPVTDYEGNGIGLTIVRKAIERMGAQVGFESELGQGSNFWIQLKRG